MFQKKLRAVGLSEIMGDGGIKPVLASNGAPKKLSSG